MNTNEKKLSNIKKTLLELYSQLPDQFALDQVKTNMKRTINSINEVEQKRNKRYQQQAINDMQGKMAFGSLESAKKALEILDQMLANEEKNLQKQDNQGSNSVENELLNG